MPRVRLSSKGQIAIPCDIRRQLNLRQGTEFSITVRNDDLILTRLLPVDWRRWEGAFRGTELLAGRAEERRAELDRDARRKLR